MHLDTAQVRRGLGRNHHYAEEGITLGPWALATLGGVAHGQARMGEQGARMNILPCWKHQCLSCRRGDAGVKCLASREDA